MKTIKLDGVFSFPKNKRAKNYVQIYYPQITIRNNDQDKELGLSFDSIFRIFYRKSESWFCFGWQILGFGIAYQYYGKEESK